MIKLSDLSDVISLQREKINSMKSFPRTLLAGLAIHPEFALVISGIRRCGKSTLLSQLMEKQDCKSLFINFDTPKLFHFDFADFRVLDDVIQADKEVQILFFDEIQVVEGWEVYVRGKLDEGYRIVVTGSNASLLSRELGTKLTGRHIPKELFPFSFDEFCAFKSIATDKNAVMNYLSTGGFPQFVATENQDILQALINDIIYRDIAVRYNIRDDKSLKRLLLYLVSNVGNLVSANKLKQIIDLKSSTTILEYLSFLQQTYLIHLLPKFSYSYKKQIINPRKIYFIDTGLQAAITPSFTKDLGRKFENMVFWELRRFTSELYYFNENGKECDFVLCRNNQPQMAIQVCFELNNDNLTREQSGLLDAMNVLKINTGFIVTIDQTDKISLGDKTIEVVSFHQFQIEKLFNR